MLVMNIQINKKRNKTKQYYMLTIILQQISMYPEQESVYSQPNKDRSGNFLFQNLSSKRLWRQHWKPTE